MVGVSGNAASVLIQTALSFTTCYFKLCLGYFAYLLLILIKTLKSLPQTMIIKKMNEKLFQH
jgi:hypothetical protein